MYALQQLRFREIVQRTSLQLEDMALDPRAFPGIASEVRQLKSSASTPSLRSRESELVPIGRMTPENVGGNVRVVVRVRGFLPRGLIAWSIVLHKRLTVCRGGTRRPMSHRDGPSYRSDKIVGPEYH